MSQVSTSMLKRWEPRERRMVQRDQDATVQLVIRKGVVGTRRVPPCIDERVVPHILVAEPARLEDGPDSALKLHLGPAALQKALVLRIVRIASDEI